MLRNLARIPALLFRPQAGQLPRHLSNVPSGPGSGGEGPVVDEMNPPIPTYQARTGETMEVKKARLVYQSRKRGMLENGILLSTFAAKFLDTFSEQQLDKYDLLINEPSNDWDIYHWMTEKKPTPPEYQGEIMDMLQKHTRNEDREVRLTQPPLQT